MEWVIFVCLCMREKLKNPDLPIVNNLSISSSREKNSQGFFLNFAVPWCIFHIYAIQINLRSRGITEFECSEVYTTTAINHDSRWCNNQELWFIFNFRAIPFSDNCLLGYWIYVLFIWLGILLLFVWLIFSPFVLYFTFLFIWGGCYWAWELLLRFFLLFFCS